MDKKESDIKSSSSLPIYSLTDTMFTVEEIENLLSKPLAEVNVRKEASRCKKRLHNAIYWIMGILSTVFSVLVGIWNGAPFELKVTSAIIVILTQYTNSLKHEQNYTKKYNGFCELERRIERFKIECMIVDKDIYTYTPQIIKEKIWEFEKQIGIIIASDTTIELNTITNIN
jgi:hypothetical protein